MAESSSPAYFNGACVTTKLDGSPLEILFMFRKVNPEGDDYEARIMDINNFNAHVAAILQWVQVWDADTPVSCLDASLLLTRREMSLFTQKSN